MHLNYVAAGLSLLRRVFLLCYKTKTPPPYTQVSHFTDMQFRESDQNLPLPSEKLKLTEGDIMQPTTTQSAGVLGNDAVKKNDSQLQLGLNSTGELINTLSMKIELLEGRLRSVSTPNNQTDRDDPLPDVVASPLTQQSLSHIMSLQLLATRLDNLLVNLEV